MAGQDQYPLPLIFLGLMASWKMIINPNRFKQAGVFPGKINYSAFHAIKPEIGKIMIKNILCSPVFKIRFCKKNSSVLRPDWHFLRMGEYQDHTVRFRIIILEKYL
jgi:hypothetical protein